MRRSLGLLGAVALLVGLLPGVGAAEPVDPDVVRGAYIVVLQSGDPGSVAADHSRAHNAQVSQVYRHALRGYAARMSATAAVRVARDPRVAYVDADRIVTTAHHQCGHSHPRFGDGPCDDPEPEPEPEPDPDTGYEVPLGLQRVFWGPEALTVGYPGVAIIDTGIADHPDLDVAGGYNCSNGPAHNYRDGNGHGTHVAGTVGALGATVGVASGAPLYAVRVLNNSGSGTWSSVICGVDWVSANAAGRNIKVANMSLGGSGTAGTSCSSSSLRQAICSSVNDKKVTYVVAAGNSAASATGFVPAAYPEVITVAAIADFDGKPGAEGQPTCRTDVDDTHADFSNFGSSAVVDITAPGVCITSTWHSGSGYNTISGTSMSSPHVAGAAAQYLQKSPGATPSGVRTALKAATNLNYSYTWSRSTTLGGDKPPLLDVSKL